MSVICCYYVFNSQIMEWKQAPNVSFLVILLLHTKIPLCVSLFPPTNKELFPLGEVLKLQGTFGEGLLSPLLYGELDCPEPFHSPLHLPLSSLRGQINLQQNHIPVP